MPVRFITSCMRGRVCSYKINNTYQCNSNIPWINHRITSEGLIHPLSNPADFALKSTTENYATGQKMVGKSLRRSYFRHFDIKTDIIFNLNLLKLSNLLRFKDSDLNMRWKCQRGGRVRIWTLSACPNKYHY